MAALPSDRRWTSPERRYRMRQLRPLTQTLSRSSSSVTNRCRWRVSYHLSLEACFSSNKTSLMHNRWLLREVSAPHQSNNNPSESLEKEVRKLFSSSWQSNKPLQQLRLLPLIAAVLRSWQALGMAEVFRLRPRAQRPLNQSVTQAK